MLINTRDFGKLEIDENEIVSFVQPVLGFEDYSKYILLFDEQIGDSFAWLQSVEDSDLCFMLANPKLLGWEYKPEISSESLDYIENNIDEIWLVAVINDDIKKSKVNLKSPIIVNNSKKIAIQVVSENKYPVKYELFSGKEI